MDSDTPATWAEVRATWHTPQACIDLVSKTQGNDAKGALMGRLKGGLITAVAESSSRETSPRPTGPVRIEAAHWGYVSSSAANAFWITGDTRIYIPNRDQMGGISTFYYGVRLDPVAVRAMIPPDLPDRRKAKWLKATPKVIAEPPAPTLELVDKPIFKGPRVASAHLEAWHKLYCQTYPGTTSEEHALLSARGMFPGKSVSRDAVRGLRGRQALGRPKSKDDQSAT